MRDPIRASAIRRREVKRRQRVTTEKPKPPTTSKPGSGPGLVTQGVRSNPPPRTPPSPDDLLREIVFELRGRPKTIRIE